MTEKDKIQKLELETVKAITELKADVKNLTATIEELRKTIQDMTANYVKREEFVDKINEFESKLKESKKAGRIHAILWSLLTALITTFAVIEINRFLK